MWEEPRLTIGEDIRVSTCIPNYFVNSQGDICVGDKKICNVREFETDVKITNNIDNNQKYKKDETELQNKNTPVKRRTGNQECRICNRRNKVRITFGHLGYKTIS